eukprot:scaffold13501_cov20-Tisochrysis_lutea.AAC.5
MLERGKDRKGHKDPGCEDMCKAVRTHRFTHSQRLQGLIARVAKPRTATAVCASLCAERGATACKDQKVSLSQGLQGKVQGFEMRRHRLRGVCKIFGRMRGHRLQGSTQDFEMQEGPTTGCKCPQAARCARLEVHKEPQAARGCARFLGA